MKQCAAVSASLRFKLLFTASVIACVAPSTPVCGADEPGGGSLQQNQLMRQHQQDALQLRMLQQQRSLQAPPNSVRERQELERRELNQEQRQRELQYRQTIKPSTVHPDDNPDIRRAKRERDLREAKRSSATELRRFDVELKQGTESRRTEKARGEVRSPQLPDPLQ